MASSSGAHSTVTVCEEHWAVAIDSPGDTAPGSFSLLGFDTAIEPEENEYRRARQMPTVVHPTIEFSTKYAGHCISVERCLPTDRTDSPP
jgi:hypothetical protein